MQYYHARPQQGGHIAEKSPSQAFCELVEAGWQSYTLDPANLAMQLCDKEPRVVGPGGCISWKNRTYRSDKLLPYAGTRVTIGAPFVGDDRGLFVFMDEDTPVCVAEPETVYPFDDGRGAGERQRQGAELRRQLRVLEAEAERRDPLEVMRDAAAVAGPVPHAESAGTITISPEHDAVAREYADLPTTPAQRRDAEAERRAKYERKLLADTAARQELLEKLRASG